LNQFADYRIVLSLGLKGDVVAWEDTGDILGSNDSSAIPEVVVFRGHTDFVTETEWDLMLTSWFEVL